MVTMTRNNLPARRLRAATYCRLSQASDQMAATLERQQQDTDGLCRLQELEVVHRFQDAGVSAHSGAQRPGYTALLDAIRRGEVDRVVVWHTDRLHRRSLELAEYLNLTAEQRVKTLAVQGNGYDPLSADGRLIATVLGAIGEQESAHKGERVRRAAQQRLDRGVPRRDGGRMFGYDDDATTPREPEAEFIRTTAQRVLDGVSLRRVAMDAQAAGLTSVRGNPLDVTSVRRFLTNPYYAGLTSRMARTPEGKKDRSRPREIVGRGSWTPILAEDTFHELQARLNNPAREVNRKGTTPVHLMSGIAQCACGGPVHVSYDQIRTSAGKTTRRNYRCHAKTVRKVPGPHTARNADDVDGFVTTYVLQVLEDMDIGQYLTTSAADDGAVGRLMMERERLMAKVTDLEARFLDMDSGQWDRLNRQVQERLSQVDAAISAAGGPSSSLAGLVGSDDLVAAWAGMDLEARRGIVRELVTVTLLPVPRGTKGFHPEYLQVELRSNARAAMPETED